MESISQQAGASAKPRLGARLRRLDGAARVWALTAFLSASALALYFGPVRHLDPLDSGFRIPWWVLAAMFYLVEVYVVHLQIRRDAYSFSLSEIPLVLGLFFASPSALVLAQVVGAAAALTFPRRQSPLKLAFNVSQFAVECSLAAIVFHSLVVPGLHVGPVGWAATFLATLLAGVLGVVLIAVAISFSEGRAPVQTLTQGLWIGIIVMVTNTSLALVGITIVWEDPQAAWLLLVPTATVFFAYRAYTSERQKHESLGFLYESSRVIHQSLQFESAILALLSQARKMFRAEIAQITLFPSVEGEPALRTILGPGEKIDAMKPVELDPLEGVWARVASEGESVLVAKPIQNERLRRHFESEGIRDAMVAPLHGETGVIGTMMVGNRLGDVGTFYTEDLKVFETLANHASVSLENARLVGRLEESLAHLTEMNRLKDDFVASVSHELRTPLTSIQGYVKTLLRRDADFQPDQRRSFLESVDSQSERLRNLIEDLLVVSRIESNGMQPELRPLSLPAIATEVVEELRPRARGHTFEFRFDDALPIIESDEGKIRQILSNLTENAVKYAPRETKITIHGRLEDDGVVISIEDEGHGIPVDLQEQIFDRFYQVNQSSTREIGGTGLGLYICRRMAQVMGARVWLEQSGSTGSVFSVWIPCVHPGAQVSRPGNRVEAERPVVTVNGALP